MTDQDTPQEATAQLGPFPGKLHYSTAKAVDALKEGKEGDTFTREELATIIGRNCDIGSLGYGNVNSAIRHVESNHGIVWRWDTNRQAWLCLGPAECVKETRSTIRLARKRARRALTVAKAVDVARLDDDTRREHNLNVAVSGMLLGGSSSQFRRQLALQPSISQPDTRKLLALFGNGENKG